MEFIGTFWALVPPLVAIVLALITKETYSSLFVGILVGALLLAGFHPVLTVDITVQQGLIPAVSESAGIFIFLVVLGIFVALLNSAGGAAAFGKWASKRVKSRVGCQLAAFFLGVLLFIDDYFNCLAVGPVMRPVTDQSRISRSKLSYIIDATAAPICMIAPVSSWAAAVTEFTSDIEGVDGITLFINAIPFNFYSLLTIVFVIALCIIGVDYGPMARAELEAWNTGDLGALTDDEPVEKEKASLWSMVLPVILLIVCCVLGLMYVGGFWDAESGVAGDLIGSFGNTDAFVALPIGSIVALVFTVIFLVVTKSLSFRESMGAMVKGFEAMVPAILILTMAVALKNLTSALGAAEFVAGLMSGAAAGLFVFLPALIFLVALGLAFATGTSWGTFGILIPVVLPIFTADPTLQIIGISACLAGAVCGDHISPISDTTIMASAGANVNHLQHVRTQLPYALTVAGISFVCFLLAGFTKNAILCLVVGMVLIVVVLLVIKKTFGVCVGKQPQGAGTDGEAAGESAPVAAEASVSAE